jgi:hypothetical protein
VLAYLTAGGVLVRDGDTGRVLARLHARLRPRLHTDLAWSTDGRRLLVVNDGALRVYGDRRRLAAQSGTAQGYVVDAAFVPGSHRVLVARTHGAQSTISELGSTRTVFSGTGVFDEITPSSGGRWLLVEWRTADQWVFVRLEGTRTIRAAAGIARQFRGKPVVEGWCCAG